MGNMENKNFLQDGITYFKEVLETLPEFKEASEKLSKISFGKIVEKCIQTINAPGSYEVLNHGDYHIKNMMFKGNNNKDISEVILVKSNLLVTMLFL